MPGRFSPHQGAQVYPSVARHEPQHRQIADFYAARITAGEEGFRPGDKLPSIRAMAAELNVSQQTAAHAVELLKTARLVTTSRQRGTRVAEPRNALGPDDLLAATSYPPGARTEVRSAALVPAAGKHAYVRGALGLAPRVPGLHVIRREEVISDSTGPYILRVTWVPQQYAAAVPELLAAEPLPDPAGAAHMITARTGLALTFGDSSREARPARADGREDAVFGAGAHILAETWVLGTAEAVLQYTEQDVREGRVMKTRLSIS